MERLEHYYANELQYLADAGRAFAERHPQEAALLHPDNVRSRDPHVERLFENFAFLSGSLRAKLEDELPELSQSLLALLNPACVRPVPALTTVRLVPDFSQLTKTAHIPAGSTIKANPMQIPSTGSRVTCVFKTCYDVELHPAELTSVRLTGPVEGKHAIELDFTLRGAAQWKDLGLDTMRLHLHGESFQLVYSLYYHLMRRVAKVELVGDSAADAVAGRITPVGFGRDEAVIPYDVHTFPGFRLIHEYFCFAEKYLYVDIGGFSRMSVGAVSKGFTIRIRMTGEAPPWWRLSHQNFVPFCTPAVNLYPEHAYPIDLDLRRTEYPLMVDRRDPEAYAVHSVVSVSGRPIGESAGESRTYRPFLSFRHGADGEEAYYHCTTRWTADNAPETYLSLVTPEGSGVHLPEQVISADVVCFNGDFPRQLRPGDICHRGDDMSHLVKEAANLASPTAVRWPRSGGATEWHFIAHLSLNAQSMANPDALTAMLRLYEWTDDPANARRISGLKRIAVSDDRAVMVRKGTVLQGMDVRAELDEACFTEVGDALLFAEVLRHFLALFASINSFVRLRVTRKGSVEEWEWPALDGNQAIV